MDPLHDVTTVEVIADHRLRLSFSDGTVGEVSFAGRTWEGVFAPLSDPSYFAQVQLDRDAGTIAWPNGVDMAPEALYERARDHPVAL